MLVLDNLEQVTRAVSESHVNQAPGSECLFSPGFRGNAALTSRALFFLQR